MNDPIAGINISCDDIGIVDHHSITKVNNDIGAVECWHRAIDKIRAHDFTSDNMVGEDCCERGDVSKESLDSPGRKSVKSRVVRSCVIGQ